MANRADEIKVIESIDELPGGLKFQGESIEEATKGLFDALGSEEEFSEEADDEGSQTDDVEDDDAGSDEEDSEDEDEDDSEDEDDESEDDEDDESEDEDDDSEEDESEDGDESDEEGEDLYKVTLPGGEKAEVTLDELTEGYSRTEDYTRKRQRDAKEHSDAMVEIRGIREQYSGRLDKLEEVLGNLGPDKPTTELRKENPGEYAAQMAEYQDFQNSLQLVESAKASVDTERSEEDKDAHKAFVDEEWDKLVTIIPAWTNAETATKDLAALRQHALSRGFTAAEMDNVSDHRLLHLLWEDYKGKQTTKKVKKKVEGKKTKSRKRLKSGGRKLTSKSSTRKKQQRLADEQAAVSGNVNDAARAIELALGDELD